MNIQHEHNLLEVLFQAVETLKAMQRTLEDLTGKIGNPNLQQFNGQSMTVNVRELHEVVHGLACKFETFEKLQTGMQSQYVNPDAQPALDTQAQANRSGIQQSLETWTNQGCQYDIQGVTGVQPPYTGIK
jgi:hypothetical protein